MTLYMHKHSMLKTWFYSSIPLVSNNVTANVQKEWSVGLKKVS